MGQLPVVEKEKQYVFARFHAAKRCWRKGEGEEALAEGVGPIGPSSSPKHGCKGGMGTEQILAYIITRGYCLRFQFFGLCPRLELRLARYTTMQTLLEEESRNARTTGANRDDGRRKDGRSPRPAGSSCKERLWSKGPRAATTSPPELGGRHESTEGLPMPHFERD